MKILLTGISGQVGAHLRPLLTEHNVVAVNRAELDLTDTRAIAQMVDTVQPDVVVNPAAYTAVDKAETERETAFAINTQAPAAFAQACKKVGALLIHFSTDYVFDGDAAKIGNRAWREDDATAPTSVYGASKRDGEIAIAQSGCDHLIFRTSWVYSKFGKNFLLTMQRLTAEKDALRVVADQHGTPNAAGALAQATVDILKHDREYLRRNSGLYNLTSQGHTTWHGFASAIVDLGTRKIPVHAIATAEFPTPAKRPAFSVLDGGKLTQTFGVTLPHWRDALVDCLAKSAPQV